jgi:16S rRNA (guanine527-N7)-methyltransferase
VSQSRSDLKTFLEEGINKAGLDVGPDKQEMLLDYVQLLEKWNKAFNLTAIDSATDMVTLHLLDCLAVMPGFKPYPGIMDLGSGAGLPGIPLAICFPEKRVVLVESNGKKASFLRQVKQELGLDNLDIREQRIEQVEPEPEWGQLVLTCRALATLADIIHLTRKLWNRDTTLLAMKGKFPDNELSQLPKSFNVASSLEVDVPGLDAERHLLVIRQTA